MNISPALQRTLSRSALKVSKYSPQILTAVGIAGLVTAGIIAAKNTLKLEETLDNSRNRLELVKEHPEATQSDVNKVYAKNVFDLAKLYGIPVTLSVASIVAILVGHNILHKRNLALIAAYKGLEQAFSEYRKRVVEEYGEDVDEKFRYGIRDVVDVGEDGKKVKSQTVSDTGSDYIMSFGPENDNWTGNHEHNLFYVTRGQQWFNDKLQAQGHVFLQDVTRYLGLPDSKVGAVTGWVYDKNTGDDYIDFGIKDLQNSHGYILLDFNVDGVILDLI
jgi:hypothetical protein